MATVSREHALRAVRDHANAIGGAMNDAMEQLRCDGESAAGQEAIRLAILRAERAASRLMVAIVDAANARVSVCDQSAPSLQPENER